MKNMKRILSAAAVFVLAGSMLAGCGSSSSDENTLVMATNATFPPYEYVEGDEIVGIDPEIAAAIADELGMELQIEDVEFDSIVAGVASGKYDMGMAGMTVDPERLETATLPVFSLSS